MQNSFEIHIKIDELLKSGGDFSLDNPVFFKLLKSKLANLRFFKNRKNINCSDITILKRSLDFRKKTDPNLVLTMALGNDGTISGNRPAVFAPAGKTQNLGKPPIVVGFGPAGMFCALTLARNGLKPVVIERGADIETRTRAVHEYWTGGQLNEESNVQFGEGGAGAFSDGKLTTLVKEKNIIGRQVLELFVEFGAPEDILIDSHPHIGTDLLRNIVKNIREEIISLGGEVLFNTKLVNINIECGRIIGVTCAVIDGTGTDPFPTISFSTDSVFLAIGHSSRDTYEMLLNSKIALSSKPTAMGLRIEHPQALINQRQYGQYAQLLSARYPAIYKLVYHDAANPETRGKGTDPDSPISPESGSVPVPRSAFSFCMCPGGYVVNASSEPNGLVTNGMSYSKRDGLNANSAILVGVTPADYTPYALFDGDPLAGMRFQCKIEQTAFELTKRTGKLPVQSLEAFACGLTNRIKTHQINTLSDSNQESNAKLLPDLTGHAHSDIPEYYRSFSNQTCGITAAADLSGLYPEYISLTLYRGLLQFDRQLPGFAYRDAILTGPETRSSSPVRIVRSAETMESISAAGLYPIGEGAGYAGGIVSSGIDGIKAARAFISNLSQPR